MNQRQMEKGLWSTSTVVMALAILSKPSRMIWLKLMSNGDAQIKEFSEKVNELIKKIEEAKHPTSHKASASAKATAGSRRTSTATTIQNPQDIK